MILLELAAQGVRGVAPTGGRATLRPGYNVVKADGATLRRLIEALFYLDPSDAEALPRATGGPANAPVRAGLTIVGNDRFTYRLVRDFAAGAQLHRFDPEKRSFALVSQELAQIAQVMQQTVGVPPPGRLGALLTVSASDLPSKQGGGVSGVPPLQRGPVSPEQARKRIQALEVELGKAKIAEKLQFQIDGLQAKLFKIEEALKGGAKIREGLEKAEAARAEFSAAAEVAEALGNAEAKLAAYEKATARREEAQAKVAAERDALAPAAHVGPPRRFWRDPLFWAGVAGGVVFALSGLFGASVFQDMRYLALLDIPAFGWAGWIALRWVGGLEEWERSARRRRVVDDWEKKIEAQYEKNTAEVREVAKVLGAAKPSELKEALGRAADADAVVAEWRKRLADWEASPDARSALDEKAKVEEALGVVEARFSSEVGGFIRDVRSIESEMRRLESEAAARPTAVAAPATAAKPQPAGDPLRALVERAAAELGGSPAAAVRTVAQKASQALSGLSFQRLQAIQVDERGNVHLQSGGRPVAAVGLPPADRDMLWLALKLSFMEHALASGKLVAIADDAFGGLSEGARRFAGRLLKQIAKPGQILHATSDPSFREAADHAA